MSRPPPDMPRADWSAHPNYPTQALLLDSHDTFRHRSAWIIERVAAVDPEDASQDRRRRRWVNRMSTEFEWWMSGMSAHERYEEGKLYPYLATRYDVSFAALIDGHRELGACKLRVRAAFHRALAHATAAVDGPDRGASHLALLAALRDHRARLDSHLSEEEDLVIPMLLALSPREFQRYYRTPISELFDAEPGDAEPRPASE